MKELAQLQKEKNDWRCNSWLESATGRSTALAASPGATLTFSCFPGCSFFHFDIFSLGLFECHAMT